jgi:hypothetical protein
MNPTVPSIRAKFPEKREDIFPHRLSARQILPRGIGKEHQGQVFFLLPFLLDFCVECWGRYKTVYFATAASRTGVRTT